MAAARAGRDGRGYSETARQGGADGGSSAFSASARVMVVSMSLSVVTGVVATAATPPVRCHSRLTQICGPPKGAGGPHCY